MAGGYACLGINGSVLAGSQFVNDVTNFAYTQFNFDFTATGSSTTLLFEFQEDPAYWHLDDVDVEEQTTAVPEPGSLALAGCGVVTLLGYRWRRRRQAS